MIELAPKPKVKRVVHCIFALAFIVFLLYLPYLFTAEKQDCAIAIPTKERMKSGGMDNYKSKQCVDLEVVNTDTTRAKGLSGRTSMNDSQGMLFVFEMPDEQCIWMKDMNFSLDIVWVNENKEVIEIKRGVSPETYPETYCSGPAKYVIELNAGVATKARLNTGQKLDL